MELEEKRQIGLVEDEGNEEEKEEEKKEREEEKKKEREEEEEQEEKKEEAEKKEDVKEKMQEQEKVEEQEKEEKTKEREEKEEEDGLHGTLGGLGLRWRRGFVAVSPIVIPMNRITTDKWMEIGRRASSGFFLGKLFTCIVCYRKTAVPSFQQVEGYSIEFQ